MAFSLSFWKDIGQKIGQDDCPGMAAEMTYHLMLASAPALIFIFALLGMFGNDRQIYAQVQSVAGQVMPGDALRLFQNLFEQVIRGSSGGLAIVSLLGALWAGSNGATVVLKGLHRAYGSKPRGGFIRQKLLSFLILLVLGGAIFLASNLLIFGNILLEQLQNWQLLQESYVPWLQWGRWAIALVAVLSLMTWLYTLVSGPANPQNRWKSAVPGAVAFLILWIAISLLFSLYVQNFGRYNQVYGTLGGVVVLMLWLYLSSLALLIGAEINAALQERKAEQ